jgi:hypothetical protein
MLRCASCVPHPRHQSKKSCGSHAELSPCCKVRSSPGRNKGIPLTHTTIPKISPDVLPSRNAIPSIRPGPCQAPARNGQSIVCEQEISAAKRSERLGLLDDTGNPVARGATGSALPAPPMTSGPESDPRQKLQKLKSRFAVAYQPPPSPRSRIQPPDTPSLAAPTVIPVRCEPTRT